MTASPWRRRLDRREFLGLSAAAGLGISVAACGGGGSEPTASPEPNPATEPATPQSTTTAPVPTEAARPPLEEETGELSVFTWAGYEDPNLFPGYTDRFPLPSFAAITSDPQALGKVSAGFRPDVHHPSINFLPDYLTLDVVQPWDVSLLPNFEKLFPAFPPLGQIDGAQYLLPIDWGYETVLYRSDKVEPKEESWSLLFDERYAGKITWADGSAMLTIAAYVNGIPDPWAMTDEELAEMKEFLLAKKPLTRFMWQSSQDWAQGIEQGDIWIAGNAWADSYLAMKDKVPIVYSDVKEGRWAWVSGLVLGKDTENYHHSHEFANAWLSPESALYELEAFAFGRTTEVDTSSLNPELVSLLHLDEPSILETSSVVFLTYQKDRGRYNEVWNEIRASA